MPKLNEPAERPLRYFLIRLEETRQWDLSGYTPSPDHIYATYLCTPDCGVHLCELTPSTELEYISTCAEFDFVDGLTEAQEEAQQDILEKVEYEDKGAQETFSYMHRADVLRTCKGLSEWLEANEEPDSTDEYRIEAGRNWVYVGKLNPDTEEGKEALEELRENVRSNCYL